MTPTQKVHYWEKTHPEKLHLMPSLRNENFNDPRILPRWRLKIFTQNLVAMLYRFCCEPTQGETYFRSSSIWETFNQPNLTNCWRVNNSPAKVFTGQTSTEFSSNKLVTCFTMFLTQKPPLTLENRFSEKNWTKSPMQKHPRRIFLTCLLMNVTKNFGDPFPVHHHANSWWRCWLQCLWICI